MKRPFNFFDAVTVMLIYIAIIHPEVGVRLWMIFASWAVEFAWDLARVALRYTGVEHDFARALAAKMMRWSAARARRRLKKETGI